MNGAFARIVLRYGVGALVAHGILSGSLGHVISNDPDVAMFAEVIAGGIFGLVSEGYYLLAKKCGWPT